jgi:PEP-CTERM motif
MKPAIFGFLFIACTAGSAYSATIVEGPVSDAFGTDQPRDGIFDSLFPTSPANVVGGTADSEYRSALEFALSPVPPGATIASAMLVMHGVLSSGSGGQMDLYVHSYAGNGVAELSNLMINNPVAGPITEPFGPVPDSVQFDVSTAVRSLYLAGAAYAGLSLHAMPPAYVLQFGSMENPNLDSRPTLVINYSVPEPASMLLAGVAALCLIGVSSIAAKRR